MTPVTPTKTEQAVAGFMFPRMGWAFYLAIALLAVIAWFAQHMIMVAVFKLFLITLGAVLGYWVSRWVEARGVRPHELLQEAAALRTLPVNPTDTTLAAVYPSNWDELCARAWQCEQLAANAYQRRAWIVAAAMMAAALGS